MGWAPSLRTSGGMCADLATIPVRIAGDPSPVGVDDGASVVVRCGFNGGEDGLIPPPIWMLVMDDVELRARWRVVSPGETRFLAPLVGVCDRLAGAVGGLAIWGSTSVPTDTGEEDDATCSPSEGGKCSYCLQISR